MKLNKKKILYISVHDPEKDPGVEKKIEGFCKAARSRGYEVGRVGHYCRTVDERKRIMSEALKSDAGIFVIRSFGVLTSSVTSYFKQAGNEGRILICDQPTPLSSTLLEILKSPRSLIKRGFNIARGIWSGPRTLRFYNRIIEYAPEGRYFSLGNRNRIKLIGNGIDISSLEMRTHSSDNQDSVRLLGVASVSPSHGFDRVIKALGEVKRRGKIKVSFNIIGGAKDSPIIRELRQLARKEGVEEDVVFHGYQKTDYIREYYDKCDLAVGALGLSRVGLNVSSILKIREYALAGIPFITSGDDPDFTGDEPFRIVVPNDESIDPVVEALETFPTKRKTFTDNEIREFAINNLSYGKKFDQIIDGLV